MVDYKKKRKAGVIDEFVGKRLRSVRVSANLSQQQIAEVIGVTFQQIQKYELGKNRISAGNLYILAKFLNITLDDFYEGLEEEVIFSEIEPWRVEKKQDRKALQ